jgi:transposase-like protein
MRLADDVRGEIVALAARLDAAPWGSTQPLIAQAARDHGVSAGTLWRWIRLVRGARRHRAQTAIPAAAHIAYQVALVKEKVRRNGRMMSTERALQQLGITISRATIDRLIRCNGLLAEATVHEKKISERPNDMHQFDVTGSKVLFVAEKGADGDWILETRTRKFRRNQAAERLGLWIFGLVDDHSRVRYAEYVVAAGESFAEAQRFLSRAWGGDPRCELCGLPRELNADYGPLRSSERGKHLMESLGVAFTKRMPESPNVGGKIERIWPDLFRDFESLFDLREGTRIALRPLNEELGGWCAQWNRRAHPDWSSMTRLEAYARLDRAGVRYFPEDVADGIYTERIRTVDEFARVRYHNAWYRVPEQWTGNVEVIESFEGRILIRNIGANETVAAPIAEASVWGTYRGHFDTANQTLKKDVAQKQFDRIAFSGAPVLAAKFGPDAKIESPFTQHEEERAFANEDAAVDWARGKYGVDLFVRNMGLTDALREMARAVALDRAEFQKRVDGIVEATA